jgi:hypothetical protein
VKSGDLEGGVREFAAILDSDPGIPLRIFTAARRSKSWGDWTMRAITIAAASPSRATRMPAPSYRRRWISLEISRAR